MAKEQTTMIRCFSDTSCQLSELPDIWPCLDLLRSGTAAANLETAHPSPHLSGSISPRFQATRTGILPVKKLLPERKSYTPLTKSYLQYLGSPHPKKTTYWEHLHPQQNTMLAPRRDFHYIREASRSFLIAQKMLAGRVFLCMKKAVAWALCLLIS